MKLTLPTGLATQSASVDQNPSRHHWLVLASSSRTILPYPSPPPPIPFWAQQTYPATPREATGRIVCANCHLAAKPTEIEVPQSVKPDTVFEAVVKIPYDLSAQQVTANGG